MKRMIILAAVLFVALMCAAAQANTVSLSATGDTMLDSGYPTNDYGLATEPNIFNDGNKELRTLIKFDASVLRGSTINSATLYLSGWSNDWWNGNVYPATTVYAYALTRDWIEGTETGNGANWNTCDGVNAWTSPGGDFGAYPVASATTVAGVQSYTLSDNTALSFNLKTLVQQWADGVPNYGLLLKLNSSSGMQLDFIARDRQWGNNPVLVIDYTIPVTPSQVQFADVADTSLWAVAPGTDRGASERVWIFNDGNSGGIRRALLKFNVDGSVINGGSVLSAQLYLSGWPTVYWGSQTTISAYYPSRSWIEGTGNETATNNGANWNTYNGINAWTVPGGDYGATQVGSVTTVAGDTDFYNSNGDALQMDVTSAVQGWLSGAANNGLILTQSTATGIEVNICSREWPYGDSNRPFIKVQYVPRSALGIYTIADLSASGVAYGDAFAINNLSQIIGIGADSTGAVNGYRWMNGSAVQIPSLGGSVTYPYGINATGNAVGQSTNSSAASRAFIWQGSASQDFGLSGAGCAWGVNAAGRVAGYATQTNGFARGFVWQSGSSTQTLATLGGSESYAYDINDSGVVVGDADIATGDYHACKWTGTTTTDLGTLGGANSTALAVNNSGVVVGFSEIADGSTHAFAFNTAMSDIGTLGGTNSEAYDINTSGIIVGRSMATDGTWAACMWKDGRSIDLNWKLPTGSDWHLDVAYGINDHDQIVGTGTRLSTGAEHAFLMTPEGYVVEVPNYSLDEVKGLDDESSVKLTAAEVTVDCGNAFYVENSNRTIGIRVSKPSGTGTLTAGVRATITGTIKTNSDGERYIDAWEVTPASGTATITPLGVTNKALCGGDADGQRGTSDGSGLNNAGLLVKAWGVPSLVTGSTDRFTIDDGSGKNILVVLPAGTSHGWTSSSKPAYVAVTGAAGLKNDSGSYSAVIYVRGMSGVVNQ